MKNERLKHIETVKLPFLINAYKECQDPKMKMYYFDQAAKYGEIAMKIKNNIED